MTAFRVVSPPLTHPLSVFHTLLPTHGRYYILTLLALFAHFFVMSYVVGKKKSSRGAALKDDKKEH